MRSVIASARRIGGSASASKKLREFTDRGGTRAIADGVMKFVSGRSHLFRECFAPVLCHNDLHPGNVLAKANGALRLSGVLDFENALAGDPLMDIAKTLYYAADGNRQAAVLAGYGGIGRQSWSETLELYRLYYVVELWCWMAQIGNKEPLAKLALDMQRCALG